MQRKDGYGLSIIFLILFFLMGSAMVVAYDDVARTRSARDPASREHHELTFPVSYQTAETLEAEAWSPAIMLENLGAGEAIVTVTAYDADGAELVAALVEDYPISIPAGGTATIPLPGVGNLPSGEYSFALSANQPITGSVVRQTPAGEVQDSDL